MKIFYVLLIGAAIAVVTSQPADRAIVRRCAKLFTDESCSSASRDRLTTLTTALIQCNRSEVIITSANRCARSESGTGPYCSITSFYAGDALTLFTSHCFNIIYGGPTATCIPECKAGLEELSSELGCCINSFYNNTGSHFGYLAPLFSYRVFSACDVPTITDQCVPEFDPETIDVVNTNDNCSYAEGQQLLLSSTCTSTSYDHIRGAVDSSCDVILDFYRDYCSVDANNEFCVPTEHASYDFQNHILPMNTYCTNWTACSPLCRDTLQNFQNDRGCCINAIYNSTLSYVAGAHQPLLADASLFTLCGLTPPTQCSSPFTSSGSMMLGSNIILMAFLALVVYMMNLS
jgi:hypothetical protein